MFIKLVLFTNLIYLAIGYIKRIIIKLDLLVFYFTIFSKKRFPN